jgi:hypothetical protein
MTTSPNLSLRTNLKNLDIWIKSNNKGVLHLELEDLKSIEELNDYKVLLQIWSSLLPGGELCTSIPLSNLNTSSSQSDTLRTAFLLNGFVQVNIQIVDSLLVISVHRPSYDLGSRVALATAKVGEKPVWRLGEEHVADDEQLIDAHALLTDEDRERPSVPLATACAPSPGSRAQASGARRACKNCTCGLAEQLDRKSIAAAADAPVSANSGSTSRSACGSCYLGDAFRCTDCPYRGLPPFKPGDRVVLDARDAAH